MALLGNLIPGDEKRIQISNIFAKDDCAVYTFDSIKLRKLIENDNEKLMKLWRFLSKRYIILHQHSELKFFDLLDESLITLLTKMSEIKVYNQNDGNKISMKHGAIVLQGSINICEESKEGHSDLKQEVKCINYYQCDKEINYEASQKNTVVMHLSKFLKFNMEKKIDSD